MSFFLCSNHCATRNVHRPREQTHLNFAGDEKTVGRRNETENRAGEWRVSVEFRASVARRKKGDGAARNNHAATSRGAQYGRFFSRSGVDRRRSSPAYSLPLFSPSPLATAAASIPFLFSSSPLERRVGLLAMHCAPVNYVRINAQSYRIQFEALLSAGLSRGPESAGEKIRALGRGHNARPFRAEKRDREAWAGHRLKLFSLFGRFVRVCNTVAKLLVGPSLGRTYVSSGCVSEDVSPSEPEKRDDRTPHSGRKWRKKH